MAGNEKFEFEELDESGNLCTTYVHTKSKDSARIDVIHHESPKPAWERILEIFTPAGYPHSVTDDYLRYQIFDSLQAFSSSIAGLISSRAVLEGVGVGDASTTPTAALVLSVVQENAGRLATILFAHRFGQALEPECKMYRLAADVFNDAAMLLECLSPLLPRIIRIPILSASSVLKALCGVSAGSAKASLSAHFARWGNIGELNAKDSSQETVISLLGMLAGTFVVSNITTQPAIWTTLFILLAVHLFTNYLAVRAVCMTTFNRQRLSILVSSILDSGTVLSPHQVAAKESIFHRGGIVRRAGTIRVAHYTIGQGLHSILNLLGKSQRSSGAFHFEQSTSKDPKSQTSKTPNLNPHPHPKDLLHLFNTENCILYLDPQSLQGAITLKNHATPTDQLKAWVHAIMLARRFHDLRLGDAVMSSEKVLEGIKTTLSHTREFWEEYAAAISDKGWDLGTAALETRSGRRIK